MDAQQSEPDVRSTSKATQDPVAALFCMCGALRVPTTTAGRADWQCAAECGHPAPPMDQALSRDAWVLTQEQQESTSRYREDTVSTDVGYTTETWCDTCDASVTATVYLQQTWAADEAPTRLYECDTCGHRWREND